MLFPEKKSYNPHVNIEYVDDKGRDLTPKEVTRSHFYNVFNTNILYLYRHFVTCLTNFMDVAQANEKRRGG